YVQRAHLGPDGVFHRVGFDRPLDLATDPPDAGEWEKRRRAVFNEILKRPGARRPNSMKVLYNWIKEFVPLEITADQAADTLRKLGFEIASLQHLGGDLTGVVSAEVKEVQKHPNADRLSLCTVTDGQQIFSVVCGADHVRAGIRVPLARVGAVLPAGHSLGAATLRGVESQGMICSAAELGMETTSEGILILDPQAPLGADIRSLLNLDDTLIDLENTPNRRDVLSVIGIARELSAALNISLKNP